MLKDVGTIMADGDLEVGETGHYILEYYDIWTDSNKSFEYENARISNSTVTVPAGTFDCVVFQLTGGESLVYLSKGIGPVKWSRTNSEGGLDYNELISYSIE